MTSPKMTSWSLIAAVGGGVLLSPAAASAADPMSTAAKAELLDKYCIPCHNYTDYRGKVEFEVYDPENPLEYASLTERMVRKLRVGMMPPAGEPRPDPAQ